MNMLERANGERMALEALGGERIETITNMDTCKPEEVVRSSVLS